MRYLLFVLLLSSSFYLKGQDTILLLSGKQFSGIAVDTSGLKINFEIIKEGKSQKQKSFYRDQVFSITYKSGYENIFYYPDMFYVNDYTVENMRFEIFGKIDGRNSYKTKWVYPVGIASGFLAGFFSKGSVVSVFIPIIYVGVVQIPIVKIQPKSISNPGFIGNEFYKTGYNQKARMKRTRDAIISGFAGLIAGILIYNATE
jgi:hypothetical protein